MATNHTDNHPQDLLAPVARDAQRSADPTCSTPRPEPLKTFDSQDLLQGADQNRDYPRRTRVSSAGDAQPEINPAQVSHPRPFCRQNRVFARSNFPFPNPFFSRCLPPAMTVSGCQPHPGITRREVHRKIAVLGKDWPWKTRPRSVNRPGNSFRAVVPDGPSNGSVAAWATLPMRAVCGNSTA